MNVIGLDLSLAATGVSAPGRTFVISGAGRGAERLAGIRRALLHVAREVEADLAVLEGYSFASNLNGARAIAELGGVVRVLLWDLGVPMVEVPPASLKLFATGRGNATKDEMLAAAFNDGRLFAGKTYDEADAYWLRELGLVIAGDRRPTDYQRQALAKVVVPNGIRRLVAFRG